MTIKVKSLAKTLIISTLTNFNLNKWRKDFMVEVFCLFLSIKGRINFLQFARYGDYGEQRYRQQFEDSFDFFSFNKELMLKRHQAWIGFGRAVQAKPNGALRLAE